MNTEDYTILIYLYNFHTFTIIGISFHVITKTFSISRFCAHSNDIKIIPYILVPTINRIQSYYTNAACRPWHLYHIINFHRADEF